MREQLIQYVKLLFAGAYDAGDMQQEILQNTLDRYDDLLAQGKTPEAAYRLAISGIGDVSELLGTPVQDAPKAEPLHQTPPQEENPQHRKYRAIAIAMYIVSPIPLFLMSEFGLETLGLCLTLGLVAAATYALFLYNKEEPEEQTSETQHPLKHNLGRVIWAAALAVYLLVSFTTRAWHITWLIFPIGGSIQGLVNAIIDLKEAKAHEN